MIYGHAPIEPDEVGACVGCGGAMYDCEHAICQNCGANVHEGCTVKCYGCGYEGCKACLEQNQEDLEYRCLNCCGKKEPWEMTSEEIEKLPLLNNAIDKWMKANPGDKGSD